jgi:hypothetical protein
LRLVLVAMIGVLMNLNAIGVFGFLTRAHLEHMAAVDLALAVRTADTLATTPNILLGFSEDGKEGSNRAALVERLRTASRALSEHDLQTLVIQAEAHDASGPSKIAAHHLTPY